MSTKQTRPYAEHLLAILSVFALWEVAGRSGAFSNGAIPAPTRIVAAIVDDAHAYPAHITTTLVTAGQGFLWGNAIALSLAVLFVLLPLTEQLLRGLLVTLFCVPLAVVAPILGIAFAGTTPSVILAALSVIFTTIVSSVTGMRSVPPGSLDVVRSAGGSRLRSYFLVQLRAGVPGILAGLQIAAPAALLGAILGEFLGGQSGIGIYLVGVMVSGSPARLWGISIVTAAICAAAYALFGVLRRIATGSAGEIAVAELAPSYRTRPGTRVSRALERVAIAAVGLSVVLGMWWYFVWWTGLPRLVANTPADLWVNLTSADAAAQDRQLLKDAMLDSLPLAGAGVGLGLASALLLSVSSSLAPRATNVLMPFAFVTQTLPLVAFAPLIALITGRGDVTILFVTILVTFFPAYVAISQGIASATPGPAEVLHSVAAGRLSVMRRYTVPQAMPQLLAAARLSVPRALLGVIIAEQLVTGTGLGGLLSRSRGYLDYSMMWAVAAVSAIVAVISYLLVGLVETRMLRRWWS